jgi:hypothetical protein
MANGWESKSVEEQQSLQEEMVQSQAGAEVREQQARQDAVDLRKVQALKLTRARICEQLSRSSSERYTSLLNTELQQIEGELLKLV